MGSATMPEAKEDYREAFAIFDKDGDGKISAAELQGVMQSLNMETTLAEATSYIQEVSQSKQITYAEFVKLMEMKDAAGWTIEEQDLRAAFKVFDADNDG